MRSDSLSGEIRSRERERERERSKKVVCKGLIPFKEVSVALERRLMKRAE
jgi:hypothetical protein